MAFPSSPDGTEEYPPRAANPTSTQDASFDYAVLTPERVSLQYDLAGVGTRSAAAMVDVSIQGTVWLVLTVAIVMGALQLSNGTDPFFVPRGALTLLGALTLGLWTLMTFLVLWGYYILFEIAWNGQTPGKRMMGLRVIRENGYPLRPSDAVVRNLVRMLDGPPVMYPVGLLFMLLNEKARRPGDFAAGTVVIREGQRRSLESLSAWVPESSATLPGIARLSGADATLVRDYLVRRVSLKPDASSALAGRLADVLSHRYGLAARRAALGDDVHFLEELAEAPAPGFPPSRE